MQSSVVSSSITLKDWLIHNDRLIKPGLIHMLGCSYIEYAAFH